MSTCNFLGETSTTIMPKRGETGNWVSPLLSVLCAHPRVAQPLTQVFSQDLVMPALLSSHFLLISKSSLPAECCPWLLLSPVAGLEKASEVPPPPS